jgi:hypothetical protein
VKVCADANCNTPIPEGKTRCPKCGQKKFVDVAGEAPAAPAPVVAAPPPVEEPKPEKKTGRPKKAEPPVEVATAPVEEKKVEEKKVDPAAKQSSGLIVVLPDEEEHAHADGDGHCARCARLRAALRDARRRIRKLGQENRTLREELLSAGEMIENLAMDIEKSTLETEAS